MKILKDNLGLITMCLLGALVLCGLIYVLKAKEDAWQKTEYMQGQRLAQKIKRIKLEIELKELEKQK